MNKRFDFNNHILVNMKLINPSTILQEKPISIMPLAKHFPNLVAEDKLQELDNEWRLLRNTDDIISEGTTASQSRPLSALQFWTKSVKYAGVTTL